MAALGYGIEVKAERILLTDAEKVMQDTQPLLVVQFVQLGVQLFHVGGQIAAHTGKKAARLLNAAALHGNRNVPLLHNAVALCGFVE